MNDDQGMTTNQIQAHARRSIEVIIKVVAVLSLAVAVTPAWPSTQAKPWQTAESTGSGAALKFSRQPRDEEFLHTGLFTEPLAPVAKTTAAENQDLARALLAYRDRLRSVGGNDEAVGPLVGYLATHPRSAWQPALQLNLGIIYRQTGHFSKALEIWQAGWRDAEDLSDPEGRALANAIVARLSQLEAYLGRKELLAPLLDSIHSRSVGGTAAQVLTDSHTGLYEMVYHPDQSFRCGPLALLRILKYSDPTPSPASLSVLEKESPSTDHGLSLTAVREIAERAGMKYQAAYREPGADVIFPAVAHWKVGHYAAIVDRGKSGRYIVQDTTFGEDIRVAPATLDEESSGYFLIPAGPLPRGWRAVSAEEGATIWGRGNTGTNRDPGATNTKDSNCPVTSPGCTTSKVELEVVGLELDDEPVGYHPPVGPDVRFDMTYSHRDTQQPATFAYVNFGSKWTFNWLSYVTDTVNSSASATLYRRGGGSEPYTFSSTSATASYAGPYTQSVMTRTVNGSGISTSFTLTHPDGSYEEYAQASGNQFFMTAVSDASGNLVTLTYDGSLRITAITDAIGQVTTLTYGLSGSPLVVTKITDPFGRSASFNYNASGLLASITDVLGITSSYLYGQGSDPDFINTLTTPYGTTTFTYGDVTTNPTLGDTRFVKTVDPLNRTSYVEFDQGIDAGDSTGGIMSSSLVPAGMLGACNQYINYRNTFVFDANQYALAMATGTLNYSLGYVAHWAHTSDGADTSRVLESEKQPLENRVFYSYLGQGSGTCQFIYFTVSSTGSYSNGATSRPTAIGRVLDNGATQLSTYQYNLSGNPTQSTDPVGRKWTYTYASNGIDRLTTSNTTSGSQLLETRTYNADHLPLTITGANGKTMRFKYNAAGQPTQYTDPLGHATSFAYDSDGRLKTSTGAISSAKYTFTYDNVSRIQSITDPAGSKIAYSYDAADRLTQSKYPDGTTQTLSYTLLDRTRSTDRLGQTTQYQYDADRELLSVTDPANNQIQFGYNGAGRMDLITDANGHTTTWTLDAESRATSKNLPDTTRVSITYANTLSLIISVQDALSQTTNYSYNLDNTVASINYVANLPTPSVSFVYDPAYPRQTSMTDGNGTTTYTYYPVTASPALGANLLASIVSPVAGTSNTDTVTYSYDALNRVSSTSINGASQSIGFDAIGRAISASNPLDAFTYGYSDGTARVSFITSTAGPSAALTYYGPTGDELLEQASYTAHTGGTSLQQFGYAYNSDDSVTSFSVTQPSAQSTTYSYDKANRLVSALIGTGSPQYVYGYDHASNLTSITPDGTTQNYSYTPTNTITSGTYDANGSPSVLAGGSYKWDGANRVVRYTNAANSTNSTFVYDGLDRLVRVIDTHAGTITGDHSYLWCGITRCLAHDNTQSGSPVSAQYFTQGTIVGGTSYYYLQDEQGGVRELVGNTGTVAAQYSYDPYGNKSTVSGTGVSDIGYAGYYYHPDSGLNFALYRGYDSTHARWLNRDPIGEAGGVNLYAYVNGNPISGRDPLGLFDWPSFPQGVVNASAGVGDGISTVLSFGQYSTADARAALGIDGGVDMCSASYRGGKYAGYAWGAGTLWAAGLNGGSASMFYAGNGARALAFDAGMTIDQTLIGSMLDSMGAAVPRPVWQLASATFAANATEPAAAIILYAAPTSIWNMEAAILAWRGISVIR